MFTNKIVPPPKDAEVKRGTRDKQQTLSIVNTVWSKLCKYTSK